MAAIPALRRRLHRDAARLRAQSLRDERAARQDAATSGPPFNGWSIDYRWKVVADTPRFLSLSQAGSSYTGGAHPNQEFGSLLWDKASATTRPAASLFGGNATFAAAVGDAFCRSHDRQRIARRRAQGDTAAIAKYERCTRPMGAVLLGSAAGGRFDRIGFLIAPYSAGAYAEGSYDMTLPVTAAILAAVRPGWRRYFAVAGTP